MRVVIIGAGTVGTKIARELIAENRDVVIIEKNPEVARSIDNELDCLVINEDGSLPETLQNVQLDTTAWFLALTGSDSVNIVACGLAAGQANRIAAGDTLGKTADFSSTKAKGPKTIARVSTSFYLAFSKSQQAIFGLSRLVNPAMEAALSIAHIIEQGFAESVIPLHEGTLQLRMLSLEHVPQFIGKNLIDIKQTVSSHFIVVAIVRNSRIIVPKGDTRIEESDSLYVLGEPAELDSLLGSIAGIKDRVRKILIVGASSIAEQLISLLTESVDTKSVSQQSTTQIPTHRQVASFFSKLFLQKKMNITLLESSQEEAKRLAQLFQNIQVIQGDPQEESILESSNVSQSDLCIATSTLQSQNITIAELSKVLGAKKSIAVVSNDRFLAISPRLDIDSFICSTDAVVSSVLASLRRGQIKTIHSFFEDNVEIVELELSKESHLVGKNLIEIELPKDVLLAFIIREKQVLVPHGKTILLSNDAIAIVCRKKDIPHLEAIFGGTDGI